MYFSYFLAHLSCWCWSNSSSSCSPIINNSSTSFSCNTISCASYTECWWKSETSELQQPAGKKVLSCPDGDTSPNCKYAKPSSRYFSNEGTNCSSLIRLRVYVYMYTYKKFWFNALHFNHFYKAQKKSFVNVPKNFSKKIVALMNHQTEENQWKPKKTNLFDFSYSGVGRNLLTFKPVMTWIRLCTK